jgi:hypothetical protein
MVNRVGVLCLVVFAFVAALGCGSDQISDAQQQSKAKAMDDIAKKDPNYAARRASHGGQARE